MRESLETVEVPEGSPALLVMGMDSPVRLVQLVEQQDSVDRLHEAIASVSLRVANVSNVSPVYDRYRRVE